MFWKTKPQFVVTIPQPCHENWQGMSVVERGLFCQSCQTVVTDFSILSDNEIINYIEQAAGSKMCGRFSGHQIDRPLVADKKVHRVGTFKKVAASLLLFYASIYKTSAQTTAAPHSTYTSDKIKKPLTTATGTVIKGKVIIDFTQQSVQGLELELKGTGIIKTTDAHGNFKFVVPDSINLNKMAIGPSNNGKLFLDSIGAMIAESEVNLDTLPLKTPIVIRLYPITDLQEINLTAKFVRRAAYQEAKIETFTSHGVTLLRSFDIPKRTPLQKMKAFFKRKKAS